ncbi:DUF6151 family protein [Roseovarius sp. 2305UL8-3]|uniref:DUF6151 family protein n=1 Tax=Roseovarius conchicola TaxID=3121636 RepID=UPI0035276BC2
MVDHTRRCGATHLRVDVPGASAGTRAICYCKDCQTAAQLHGDGADMLSPAGGSDIWQTTPDRIKIVKGAEHLKVIRLSPKGLMRWHAGCCGTPMFNTLPNLKLPFIGMILRQSARSDADAVYGKLRCHASTEGVRPGAGASTRDKGFKRAGFDVLQRMLAAWLSGRSKDTPLIGKDGKPIAPVEVITKDQRRAAIPKHLS